VTKENSVMTIKKVTMGLFLPTDKCNNNVVYPQLRYMAVPLLDYFFKT